MSIPGPLYKELHAALLGAFDRAELSQLVRTHLDANFEALTADKNLTNQIDELLRWAERRGRLRELVAGAAAERPRNAALQAISAELVALPASAFAPRLPGDGWRVPFPRNEQFVGRGEDLAALHTALQQGAAVGIRPTGLTGLGGIGKTQLAVEYCYRYRDAYAGGVFWLNAAGEWLPAFAELGRFLDEEVDGKALDRQARAVAEYFTAHPDSLLVLDNVQDPALLRVPVTPELTPAHLPCRVIFTTRRRDLGDAFTPVELSVLPEEPGLRLLLRHPSRLPVLDPAHPDHAAAADIYRILGGLPLALEIAGAHLGRLANRPLAAYRDELLKRGALAVVDDPRGKINEADLGTRHAAAVEATLAEQWAALQSDDARLLLRVAGQFAEAEAIPAARLGLLAAISDRDTGFFGAPLALALDELHDAALVEKLTGDAIRLHPLVRDFAARRTAPDEVDAFRGACAANLLAAYRDFATLENHCASRGVEALEADLITGLGFATDNIVVQSSLAHLLRMLQRESHTLIGWDIQTHPVHFTQQWLKRTLIESDLVNWGYAWQMNYTIPRLATVWLSERATPSLERTLSGHNASANAIALMPDGRRIISASDDRTLRVWNLDTGREERSLKGHRDVVNAVAVTPDGSHAVSASDDCTIKTWNIASGKEERTLEGHEGAVRAVAITPDGRRIISASDDCTLKVWDLATGTEEDTLWHHGGAVRAVAITPDGRRIISAADDCTLKVWDLATGVTVSTLEGHEDWVNAVTVTPDGRRAISVSDDCTLRVWDIAAGVEVRTLLLHRLPVLAVAVTSDGMRVISASLDRTLKIWNLISSVEGHTIASHARWVNAITVTPNGRSAISASEDGSLKLWDLATGNIEHTFTGHTSAVRAVIVTPDGERAISASQDRTLKIWNLAKGVEERTLPGHKNSVLGVTITPDGRRIISASDDRTLKIWNLVSGTEERTLTGHEAGILSVAVTPDGQRVISAAYDGTLKIWNLITGSIEHTLTGHRGSVRAVTVTRDGRHAVSASNDHTIKIWDLTTGQQKHTLTGHRDSVRSVTMTPDGDSIISASDDGTIRVWQSSTLRPLASVVLEASLYCIAVASDNVIVAGDAAGNVYCLRYQEPAVDAGKQPT